MKITNPKFVSHKIKFMREKVLTPLVSGDFFNINTFFITSRTCFLSPCFSITISAQKKQVKFHSRKENVSLPIQGPAARKSNR